jgi:hypothetical protein
MVQRTVLVGVLTLFACLELAPGAAAQEGRSIALILDASGSMNARLASGQTRIEAAKAAVGDFVAKLPANTRISYRVYGHQSPTKDRNCKDTELMVDFGAASTNRAAILARTQTRQGAGLHADYACHSACGGRRCQGIGDARRRARE